MARAQHEIAIIGGGAAGLAAAAAAAKAARRAGAEMRVSVYEASDRVGRSILATGNGRCNFSNAIIDAELYRNAAFVEETLAACEAVDGVGYASCENAVLRFFTACGLMWREESEGRLYPLANKATSVLDCLRAACAAAGVEELVESEVTTVEPPRNKDDRFTLRLADRQLARADTVIVAVGGAVAARLLPESVPFRATEPTLGPIATDSRWPRQLDNIRVRGVLELWRGKRLIAREVGEVMFRKYGVSGIAAFNISRLMEPGDQLAVDFVTAVPSDEMEVFLGERSRQLRESLQRPVNWDDMLRGMVLVPVADVLLKACGLKGAAQVEKNGLSALARVLKGLRLTVAGLGDVRQCQVHRGGVDVGAVDARTCEVRDVPGLYVVGEALDVDAPCGGYNLHWAWASGLLAGTSAAGKVAGEGVRKGGAR